MTKALIFGATGQDGSYLSELLLDKGYEVIGVARRSSVDNTSRIQHILGLQIVEGDVTDYPSVSGLIEKYMPDECYNLAAQSHVYTSFEQPVYTFQVNAVGVLNILECIRRQSPNTRLYQACHTMDTSVVTPNGIKTYNNISIGDMVYSINPQTKELELKKVLKKLLYDYEGDLICFAGKKFSQCVTPNHTVLLQNKKTKVIIERQASSCSSFGENVYSFPVSQTCNDDIKFVELDIPPQDTNHSKNLISIMESDDFMYVLGLFIGDGWVKNCWMKDTISRKQYMKNHRCPTTGRMLQVLDKPTNVPKLKKKSTYIQLALPTNDPARKKLCNILDKYNFCYKYDDMCINFSCYGLARKFLECGGLAHQKQIPDFVWDFGYSSLLRLFDGLIDSDGSIHKTHQGQSFTTVSKQLSTDFIRLVYSIGKTTTCGTYKPSNDVYIDGRKLNNIRVAYRFSISNVPQQNIRKRNIETQQYTGKVWCLEVEDNHNFMIWRNNKITYSGNSTSENFGNNYSVVDGDKRIQDENTAMSPTSPYAIAKVAAHNLVNTYRRAYGLHVSCGISMNHESKRRGKLFVTRKITIWVGAYAKWLEQHSHMGVRTDVEQDDIVVNIPNGVVCTQEKFPKLRLGNLYAYRDWGHAADYVEAMYLMLQQDKPDDYVIATGETHQVKDFLDYAFKYIGIDNWKDLVVIDPKFYRPSELHYLCGNSAKAKRVLGWEPKISFQQLVEEMVSYDVGQA